MRPLTVGWVLLSAAVFAPASVSPPGLKTAQARIREAAATHGVDWPLKKPSLLIEKKQRRLTLNSDGKAIRTYHIGLGAAPELDKERQGDHRTPEGRFYVCSRNSASQFHLFLGISYPGPNEAGRGLRQGLITPAQAEAIRRATALKLLPPQFTKLGGLVGIHGGGSGSDWTWGCIALENHEIEELWVACPLGTPIEIQK